VHLQGRERFARESLELRIVASLGIGREEGHRLVNGKGKAGPSTIDRPLSEAHRHAQCDEPQSAIPFVESLSRWLRGTERRQ